jgi:hypothetical protein
MKAGILFFLTTAALPAAEPEKTVWYDSKGKVVLVEEVGAKAPKPFVPQWVAREERRDRALKGGTRHRWSRTRSSAWGWAYPVYGFHCAVPGYYRCFPASGVRVIIR